MKNLFLVAILSISFFTISQAQTLKYYVTNGSNDIWHWAMDDAGPSAAQYELNILPGQTRTGGVTNFAFPLEWKAVDNNNCYVTTIDNGPVLATVLPTTCPGVTVIYKVVEIIPFVHYIYKAELG